MIKDLSFPIISVATFPKWRHFIHGFYCEISKVWSICYITHWLTNAASKWTNCVAMQYPPFKGALQCTSRHSRVCWTPGSGILIVSGISTWPVPSRRVNMCQNSNPSVHLTPLNLGKCLDYYYKVIHWETTISFPINWAHILGLREGGVLVKKCCWILIWESESTDMLMVWCWMWWGWDEAGADGIKSIIGCNLPLLLFNKDYFSFSHTYVSISCAMNSWMMYVFQI